MSGRKGGGREGWGGRKYAIHEEIGHFLVPLNLTAKVRSSVKVFNLM